MDTAIEVLVVLHAILRDSVAAGPGGMLRMHLPAGERLADLPGRLGLPEMEVVYAVNSLIADGERRLEDGDRIDIIPAISGGAE